MVKPHKGVIDVNGEVNIAITLLPFNYKPDEAYRDKFLIQVNFSICSYTCNFQNAHQGSQVQLTYVNIVFVSNICCLVQRRPLKKGWAST